MPASNGSSAEGPVVLSRTGHPLPLLSSFLLALSLLTLALTLAACASSQESDSIAVVQAALDRLAAGDVDGYLAHFSEDAVFLQEEGPPYGLDTERESLTDAVAHGYRWEGRDPASDGNVVTYTVEEFFRNTSGAEYSDVVAVVVDKKIIFWSVHEWRLLEECERNPSQAFCTAD